MKEKLVLVLVVAVAQFLTNCRQQNQQNKKLQKKTRKNLLKDLFIKGEGKRN